MSYLIEVRVVDENRNPIDSATQSVGLQWFTHGPCDVSVCDEVMGTIMGQVNSLDIDGFDADLVEMNPDPEIDI